MDAASKMPVLVPERTKPDIISDRTSFQWSKCEVSTINSKFLSTYVGVDLHTFKDGRCWRIVVAISLVLFSFPAPDLNIGKFKLSLSYLMSSRYKQEYVSVSNSSYSGT